MGALPANLSIATMIRVLALLCLAVLTMVATLTMATTARDLLRQSQHLPLTPRLKLTPGTDTMDTDTDLDTMVDTTVDTMATPTTATMARGLLMQRLPLLLKLTPRLTLIFSMEAITDLDIITMVATLTTATTARDLLRLIPGMDTTVDFHTTATATHTMDMAMAMVTTGASKKGSNQELTRMKCQHF